MARLTLTTMLKSAAFAFLLILSGCHKNADSVVPPHEWSLPDLVTAEGAPAVCEVNGILLVLENNMPLGGASVIHPHGNQENFRSSVKKGLRLFPFSGKWVKKSTHSFILIACKDVAGNNYEIRLPGFMDVTPDALIFELRKAGFSVKISNQEIAESVLARIESSRRMGTPGGASRGQ